MPFGVDLDLWSSLCRRRWPPHIAYYGRGRGQRLQLVESTQTAFADYYLAEQALGVSAESLRLLGEFRQTAQSRYQTGQATQQDVLQTEVEIGREQERRLTLEETRQIVVARINTLLHLPPDSSLPPPPGQLRRGAGLPDVQGLRDAAVARRQPVPVPAAASHRRGPSSRPPSAGISSSSITVSPATQRLLSPTIADAPSGR